MDRRGRNSVMWPTFTWRYRAQMLRFDAENYRTVARTDAEDAA